MSRRRHFLLVAPAILLFAAIHAAAQPLPSWWYPLGNPEGTRNNPVQLDTGQTSTSLKIKWRSDSLKGSPTLLVGGLITGSRTGSQQVVGTTGTDVLVLTERGLTRSRAKYGDRFATPPTIVLTGLLSPESPIPSEGVRPRSVGIGVVRTIRNADDEIFFFLANTEAQPIAKLTVGNLPPVTDGARLGLFPLMESGANVYLAINRSTNTASSPTANLVRKYERGVGDSIKLIWQYPVAPRLYPQQVAITRDPSLNGTFFGLGTAPYTSGAVYSSSPSGGVPTQSDHGYSLVLLDSSQSNYTHIATDRLPPGGTERAAESNTYFVVLQQASDVTGQYFRVMTEEYSTMAGRTGLPRIVLRHSFKDTTKDVAEFIPGKDAIMAQNHGWTIATANVDGRQRDRILPGNRNQDFVRNPEDELLAAYRNLDGTEPDQNTLWVLRRNALDIENGSIPLHAFIQYPFYGRLMATGHLVQDSLKADESNLGKQEVVIAHRDTLTVLRLRNYDDIVFDGLHPDAADYFEVLTRFTLNDNITSVAIADVDGDLRNDIIVGTAQSTYAIGALLPSPFGTVATDRPTYCNTPSVKVVWNRTFAGGANVRVTVIDAAGAEMFTKDTLNVTTEAAALAVPTTELPPGTYRAIISDPSLPWIADTTDAFTIEGVTIQDFAVNASAPAFGSPIPINGTVGCADEVVLERSTDGTSWTAVRTVPVVGTEAATIDTFLCPEDICNAPESITVYYRYVDGRGLTHSQEESVTFPVPSVALSVGSATDGTVRQRTVTWPAGQFPCGTLKLDIARASGNSWSTVASLLSTSTGSVTFTVPDSLDGLLRLRLCCDEGSTCTRGLASFEIEPGPTENFVAPNPFSPGIEPGETVIYYRPRQAGTVRITIYDAGRAVVRTFEQANVNAEVYQTVRWNGRNSRGDIVASGTYICVIESSGEPIILPIIVGNR